MKSSYSGFPEGLPIMLEPSGPNFAPHPKTKTRQKGESREQQLERILRYLR